MNNEKNMTPEMIDSAFELYAAAKKYRELFSEQHGAEPVVWLRNNDESSAIFICDDFHAHLIQKALGL